MNGDGISDFAIGAPGRDGPNSNGAAYVVFGKADGSIVDLNDVTAGLGGFKILGEVRFFIGESNLHVAGCGPSHSARRANERTRRGR
jgi:hypothetical protein